MTNLIYLASPYLYRKPKPEGYSDKSWDSYCNMIQQQRYEQAIDATAELMSKGLVVYSPIVATHPIAVKHKLPKGSEYWMKFDRVIIEKCDELYVLQLEGWEESLGVQEEIQIARRNGIPVKYMNVFTKPV